MPSSFLTARIERDHLSAPGDQCEKQKEAQTKKWPSLPASDEIVSRERRQAQKRHGKPDQAIDDHQFLVRLARDVHDKDYATNRRK